MKDEGRRTKDEGRRMKDEGRRTKDEGWEFWHGAAWNTAKRLRRIAQGCRAAATLGRGAARSGPHTPTGFHRAAARRDTTPLGLGR